jgi:general secretion pathway protein A
MYIQFFKLKQGPFSIAPDPHYLFMSERHREALAHLLYGVGSGGGFVLLTGEIGAGKTTVCRCFIQQVPDDCNLAYIFNPRLTVDELLQSICHEFGVGPVPAGASVKEHVDALNRFLLQAHADGRNNVLIIDEAQNLSAGVLEQLRLLTNLETSECKLLQIILIGQPELRGMLARPELEQLAQRVIARYHLEALSRPETTRYILHRLAVAGMSGDPPFTTQAMRLVHRLARGVPRRINLLCDRAMLGAYARGRRTVDSAIIKKAANEVFGARESRPWRHAAAGLIAVTALASLALAAIGGGYLPRVFPPGAATLPAGPAVPTGNVAPAKPAAPQAAGPLEGAGAAAPAPTTSAPADTMLADAGHWLGGLEVQEENALYPELARLWQANLPRQEPCQAARAQNLRCYKGHGGLAEIRQLDRPAIIKLHDDANRVHHVLLVGLARDGATLRIGDQARTVTLMALERIFNGEYATLWRADPGLREYLRAGDQGADVDWLAARLAKLNGAAPQISGQGRRFDPALARQVREFQSAQGLQVDGVAGPRTLMHLNSASGISEPRLKQADDAALGS